MSSELILYVKWGCPYCERVLDTMIALGTVPAIKDISSLRLRMELLRRGGKVQVPYIVDEWTGIEMYESEDIIRYLNQRKSRDV